MTRGFAKRFSRGVCALALLAGLGLARSAAAQWVDYPTADVPRNADGTPNLKAPAPRTREGTPDLSGLWFSADLLPECVGQKDCIPQMNLPMDQINIGRTLEGGLPYTPVTAKLVAERTANGAKDDPHAYCLPPNFPRAWSLPQYVKIAQSPKLTIVLHEFNASYRQIFTDGRKQLVDPSPSWNGYSVGHWEGDTLVVDSIGFNDRSFLDARGTPHSSDMRVEERFRRIDYGHLEVTVTITDPKTFTKPIKFTEVLEMLPDTDLFEHYCLENEKDGRAAKANAAK